MELLSFNELPAPDAPFKVSVPPELITIVEPGVKVRVSPPVATDLVKL